MTTATIIRTITGMIMAMASLTPVGLVPNGVALRLYAGLFCLTRGEAKVEPANQPRVHLTIFVKQILLFDHRYIFGPLILCLVLMGRFENRGYCSYNRS